MDLRKAARAVGATTVYVGIFLAGGLGIIALDLPAIIAGTVFTAWVGLVFAGVFVREAGRDFLDFALPTKAHAGIIVLAIVGYYAILIVSSGVLSHLTPQIDSPSHTTLDKEMTMAYVAGLFVLGVIVTPVVEKLVFRNGLQKVLTGWFNAPFAIVATSITFVGAHYWSYSGGEAQLLGLAVTLAFIFANSVIMGISYWWTDNLVVPIAIHGTINSIGITLAALGL